MSLIQVLNLTKTYKISGKKVDVLKDINLTLPESGLVVILGKSGSGKSTLLNIVGGIDNSTSGAVIFSSMKKHSKNSNFEKSFIFQHYHLLENQTALYNIMLPALIRGYDKKFAETQSKELIKLFSLDESVVNKVVRFLSGGEKERIAILRSLITNPRLILADEPTGALDKDNAIKTMNILKNASKKRLVLLVTHNRDLAKQYADRIITLLDGKIIDDQTYKNNKEEVYIDSIQKRRKNHWSINIINHNFKKRIKRNIVSIIGMTISLVFCYLLFGFSTHSNDAINKVSTKHFDYGTGTISKEFRTESDSSITLVKTLRPEENELDDIKTKFPMFEFMANYDAIFNSGELYIGNEVNKEIRNSFIYDFTDKSFDKNLIVSGAINNECSWNDIVVNEKAFNIIQNNDIHYKFSYENKIEQTNSSFIVDYFDVEEKLNIVAVVDELDFLSVPKIYFNYQEIDEIFENKELENLSDKSGKEINWKQYIMEANSYDDITSYSLRCFLVDISKKEKVDELLKYLSNEIKLTNDSLTIKEALASLTLAATVGLDVFLIIALVGSVLILGVFSFSAYNDDKKESSILSCLGAKDSEVVGIFTSESLIVVFLAFLFSTVFSWILQKPINLLLDALLDVPNLIDIPIKSFLGIKGLLPLAVLSISIIVALAFTSIPIFINKKISLKKELTDL
ncbi:MAG: ATP-binding cassette domain-containing protein [Bacilli bacterium]|nr:ATP-binding cassette domain-containing protein [Bacilli bacterium]